MTNIKVGVVIRPQATTVEAMRSAWTEADAMVVADWIAEGAWDGSALPTTMRLGDNLARSSRLN